ncbi:MAG: DUF433 domain-containing protein [Acetobacteraceae bacterium]
MNWSDCDLVERIAGTVSGVPVVKGTRVPAQLIVDNFDAGVSPEEIADMFDLTLSAVEGVIAFAITMRARAPHPV